MCDVGSQLSVVRLEAASDSKAMDSRCVPAGVQVDTKGDVAASALTQPSTTRASPVTVRRIRSQCAFRSGSGAALSMAIGISEIFAAQDAVGVRTAPEACLLWEGSGPVIISPLSSPQLRRE
jgi:hypothetical protein